MASFVDNSYFACSNGNVFWYNGCGKPLGVKESCVSAEFAPFCSEDSVRETITLSMSACENGQCVNPELFTSDELVRSCVGAVCLSDGCVQCTPELTETIECDIPGVKEELCKTRKCSEEGVWSDWPLTCGVCDGGTV